MKKRADVAAWVEKAEQDYEGAETLSRKRSKPVPDLVCFCCQQAAEKYLKSFLVWRGVKPERTHDLAQLVDACAQLDATFSRLRSACVKLSDFAVDVRYPGVPVEVEEQMAREAVEVAEQICNAISKKLPA